MTTRSLSSVGYLASSVNVSVAKLLAAAEQIGVRPSIFINGTGHFADSDEDRLRQYFAQGQGKARPGDNRPPSPDGGTSARSSVPVPLPTTRKIVAHHHAIPIGEIRR